MRKSYLETTVKNKTNLMMKNKLFTLCTSMLLVAACSVFIAPSSVMAAPHEHGEEVEEEKGPNRGRMLRDGDFAIELAIFETGVPPELRAWASYQGQTILPQNIELNVQLKRLGDGTDTVNFTTESDFLRGDLVIYEPHSFVVTVNAAYQGKTYHWHYDSLEGRTTIGNDMAAAMEIATETVSSQILSETLKVYGELKLAPDATRQIHARFPGEVKTLNVTLGQQVKKGQLLMSVEGNESLQTYNIYSPISGRVTEQLTGVGEQTFTSTLLTISDTSSLIAELAVFPADLAKVELGAPVTITTSNSGEVINSELFDSLFALNQSQAKIFRAKIDNAAGRLNAGQFVSADILIDTYQVPLAVKSQGLQSYRDFTVVYAKVGEEYEVRMLELGRKSGSWVEVLNGITVGTEYVTKNSYIIKADIEKSGAAHDH